MNKIVREHYPASRLPADLREGIDPQAEVTVTIESQTAAQPKKRTLEEIFAARQPPYRATEEIVREVRALRDEWDDR